MKVKITTFEDNEEENLISILQADIEDRSKQGWFFGHLLWACGNGHVVEILQLSPEDDAKMTAEFLAKKSKKGN